MIQICSCRLTHKPCTDLMQIIDEMNVNWWQTGSLELSLPRSRADVGWHLQDGRLVATTISGKYACQFGLNKVCRSVCACRPYRDLPTCIFVWTASIETSEWVLASKINKYKIQENWLISHTVSRVLWYHRKLYIGFNACMKCCNNVPKHIKPHVCEGSLIELYQKSSFRD